MGMNKYNMRDTVEFALNTLRNEVISAIEDELPDEMEYALGISEAKIVFHHDNCADISLKLKIRPTIDMSLNKSLEVIHKKKEQK